MIRVAEEVEPYRLADPDSVLTPALAVYPELVRCNIEAAIRQAGGAERLRPHVKTHKTRELVHLELARGVVKHKCATIAEAELLAHAGATDVLLAFPLVGPNVRRFGRLREAFPATAFLAMVDHPSSLAELAVALAETSRPLEILVDLDVGMGRTGIAAGPAALDLVRRIRQTTGFQFGGLHVYDGHVHQADADARGAMVDAVWSQVQAFVGECEAAKAPVRRLVCGGTGSFPRWADLAALEPRIETSPGTFFLNDWGYFQKYADLPYQPAAVLLTRVVSKPRTGRLTLDLGTKAVAADPPMEKRVRLLEIPDAKIVGHNEEHLIVETAAAEEFVHGRMLYAWPYHVCPTCALHKELLVIENGRATGVWAVEARDRKLSI